MKSYNNIPSINISGAHPNAAAIDETVAGALDGTQLFADWVNTLFGWTQDLMVRAQIIPNENDEANGASQLSNAIRQMKGIPGEVMVWLGQGDPASMAEGSVRVLLLEGTLIEVALYQDLVDACWIGGTLNDTATAFYRTNSGDTIRSNGGTHFRLPDTRGQFLRGLDIPGAVDPEGSARYQGSIQGDRLKTHSHPIFQSTSFINENGSNNVASGTDLECAEIGSFSGSSFEAVTVGDPETRPTNLSAQFAIWY